MTRVYLVRHATHDLVGKALAGRSPGVHLGADGRRQATRLAAHFAGREIMAIRTSPLERCRETAAPIAERLSLQVDADAALNEIDCGDWTGRTFEALARDPRWHAWNTERQRIAIPGGESSAAVQARIMEFLARLTGRAPALLVSHSDVIKVVIATLLGAPLDRHDRLQIDPASITTLDLWEGGGKVVRMNEAAAA